MDINFKKYLVPAKKHWIIPVIVFFIFLVSAGYFFIGAVWGINLRVLNNYVNGYFYRPSFETIEIYSNSEYGKFTGFSKSIFADGLNSPSAFCQMNDVWYVAENGKGNIIALIDSDKDGSIDKTYMFAGGLESPNGIACHKNIVYVSLSEKVISLVDSDNDFKSDITTEILSDLPKGKYQTNHLIVNNNILYVAQGPRGEGINQDILPKEGSILSYDLEKGVPRIYAKGFSNPYGLAVHPLTGDVIGTDATGFSELPGREEEINLMVEEFSYGWPYCFGYDESKKCSEDVVALLAFKQGIGLRGAVFYEGFMFPPEYQNNLFVALWGDNSGDPLLGRGIMRVRMVPASGSYQSEPEFFAKGFDRPVDIKEGEDENLYVLDQGAGAIYKISPNYD